ncbi:MAG: hypothetical protein EA421_06335 [Gemmatimonadales bacterium]|nr:MAG: hypothetical protein EA421_06335 [Gemmatimonadales bacterium]
MGAAALSAFLLLPGMAAAQACVGSPAMTGQFTVGGDMAFSDGATAYGVNSQANLPNRGSMGARLGAIDLDDTDDNLTSAGVNFALDLGRSGLSVCPVVGLGYDYWSGSVAGVDLDYSRITVPAGIGVGSRFGSGGTTTFIPSARAGFQHTRHDGSASVGSGTFGRTDSTTDFFVDADATLQLGRLYARGGFFRIFEDDADTVLRVGLGVVF